MYQLTDECSMFVGHYGKRDHSPKLLIKSLVIYVKTKNGQRLQLTLVANCQIFERSVFFSSRNCLLSSNSEYCMPVTFASKKGKQICE